MRDELTIRQERFCWQYIYDLNASRAAIRAGFSCKTASSLMRNPNIIARIKVLKAERAERLKIDADSVVKRLAEILDMDIGDVVEWSNLLVKLKDSNKLPHEIKQAISEIAFGKYGPRIKLVDRVKVLELLMDHLGMRKKECVESTIDQTAYLNALRETASLIWQDDAPGESDSLKV